MLRSEVPRKRGGAGQAPAALPLLDCVTGAARPSPARAHKGAKNQAGVKEQTAARSTDGHPHTHPEPPTNPHRHCLRRGRSPTPGWRGRRTRVPARGWLRRGTPIPSVIDPGQAEQTRHRASRSFVQLGAPPGRPAPRPLNVSRADGRRDGSWGAYVVGATTFCVPPVVSCGRYPVVQICPDH